MKNNKNIITFLAILCVIFIIFCLILLSNNTLKYIEIEPLQNFDITDISGLNHRTFSDRLKTTCDISKNQDDGCDISFEEYKQFPTFTQDNFNKQGLSYYNDTEISNDIKYFNNTSNVLQDFYRNKAIGIEIKET